MRNTLADLVDKLKHGQYPNEQALKQGIVLRVLNELQWDIYDPKTVWPEFNVSGTFVDFALCSPQSQPLVFLEVKQSTTFDVGEDQLMMRYAFQHGVPLAILTDGQRWSFYLPGGTGTFEERRFYHLDLLERSLEETEACFRRYLSFQDVKCGRAAEAARVDLADAALRRAGINASPNAWKELLNDADTRLVEALLEKVETSTGYRPQEDEVTDFPADVGAKLQMKPIGIDYGKSKVVRHRIRPGNSSTEITIRRSVAVDPSIEQLDESSDDNWYAINDSNKVRSKKAIDVTIAALQGLAALEPQILEEISTGSMGKGNRKVVKRRILARTREELYDNPKMLKASVEILPGWWLGTNYSNPSKAALLSLAQSIALRYGIKFSFHLV